MRLQRFIYESDASETTGGSETQEVIQPEIVNDPVIPSVEKIDFTIDELKEFGFDSKEKIREFYKEAVMLTKQTGIKHAAWWR